MILTRTAIKQFINKPRDDLRKYKRWTREQLDARIAKLPSTVLLWRKMMLHQKVGFLVGITHKKVAFWYDTGTGKTLMSLALVVHMFRSKFINKPVLVLVPTNILTEEWLREAEKHLRGFKAVVLPSATAKKWELVEQRRDAHIIVTTYQGSLYMVCDKIPKVTKKGKVLDENEMDLSMPKVKRLLKHIGGLIMDESTEVGGSLRESLPVRVCRQITNVTKFNIALSGTPFGRDPTPIWTQMFLIDRGASIGPNLGMFRAVFFKEGVHDYTGWPEYTFDESKAPLLQKLLSHRSLRYTAKQSDLPKVTHIIKDVPLPEDSYDYYRRAIEELKRHRGNVAETKNAFMKARQISSGFVGYRNDETGAKAQLKFDQNPKLELLTSLVQAVYMRHKIHIVHDFVFSGLMIAKELKRMKIGFVHVYGGMRRGRAREMLDRFDHDDSVRVFLGNEAAAFGLNLQRALYQFIYENNPDPKLRKQHEARVERMHGPHDRIFRYDLVSRGTVDSKILDFHKQGRSLLAAVMQGGVEL